MKYFFMLLNIKKVYEIRNTSPDCSSSHSNVKS